MADDWVGRVIDQRYVVEGVLGAGGMGVVLRAKHRFTGQHVALKLLKSELSNDPAIQARFLAEAQAPSAIGHPGIVRVLDAGRDATGGFLYLVMELLEGCSLRAAMARGELAPAEARRIMLELLDALATAHARGFVHRDLKPDNVFLVAPGATVKLLDFGIAKVLDGALAHVRTATGVTLGTPAYMSPEQLNDTAGVDARTDLWACGVIVYEMLSGRLPFRGDRPDALLVSIATQEADPIRAYLPHAPPQLEAFFARALARDPRLRFGAAVEMAQVLAQLPLDAQGALPTAAAAAQDTPPASYASPAGSSPQPTSAPHASVAAVATPAPGPATTPPTPAPPRAKRMSVATLVVSLAAAAAVIVLAILLVTRYLGSDTASPAVNAGSATAIASAGSGSQTTGSATPTSTAIAPPSLPVATDGDDAAARIKSRLERIASGAGEGSAARAPDRPAPTPKTTRPPPAPAPIPPTEARPAPAPTTPEPAPAAAPTCEQGCLAAARCGLVTNHAACMAECNQLTDMVKPCLDASITSCNTAARCVFKAACGVAPSGTGSCAAAFQCQVSCGGLVACECQCVGPMAPKNALALARVRACIATCGANLQCIEQNCERVAEACAAAQ